MVKVLGQAIAEKARLPEADQEQIGTPCCHSSIKIRRVRAELDKGIRSLDAGEGKPLDIEDIVRRSKEPHGRS